MDQALTVLVTGCRYWQPVEEMKQELSALKPSLVIHGACSGVDSVADSVCKQLDINIVSMPAEWRKYGKVAGIKRNDAMVQMLVAMPTRKLVLAFHRDLNSSKGTKDCVTRAQRAGLEVRLIDGVEPPTLRPLETSS